MSLTELRISNFRNIQTAQIALHPKLNIIEGLNGSGKTSFLEALYLLATGHSFRAREHQTLIHFEAAALTLFAQNTGGDRISLQKDNTGHTLAKINQEACLTRSQLAHLTPCQVFYQDIFAIIDAGPQVRRHMLDWGVFHVEHTYVTLWRDYRRTLKQRNALLKQQPTKTQLKPWNHALSELAHDIDKARVNFCNMWDEAWQEALSALGAVHCHMEYQRGWDKKNEYASLEACLDANYARDCARQFTHYGAHHADLVITHDKRKAQAYLSRGQQKMLLFALKFAQAQLSNKHCMYLIDDMAAELDTYYLEKLVHYIESLPGQCFITKRPEPLAAFAQFQDYQLLTLEDGNFVN
tara:strand:+ start:2675 stop:3733 length:1059 start_codon:yes stop_codon:yes gene_type:complete